MKYQADEPAYLLMEDGTFFEGKAAGKKTTSAGEICFNTGMTGYQEIFTDPSYSGQIIVMASPHIGNYGIHRDETESESVQIRGMACREFSKIFSRPSASKSLQAYFEENNIPCIFGIDTRKLVRHIRIKGAQNAVITTEKKSKEELAEILKSVPSMKGLELASSVSTKKPYDFGPDYPGKKVAVLDFGVKTNILRSLSERGLRLKVFPWNTSLNDLLSFEPDGIMLSNGPGDPEPLTGPIQVIRELVNMNKPVFGICLGHQLLALSQGLKTYKMHAGHRGINHPVKNLLTGHCEITSQNHGFSVSMDDLKANPDLELTHINLNDKTVEGIRIKGKKAFSVQYHPEACPGPHDASYLFDDFVKLMDN
ncbi:MAG: glutamine-hydrolyzing carbamoyl-phosphate synthase small subunit [Bacteroidia bacterium]|nr:glutamine-hydrolyzing carbamoyl-phosphate synthase small subunit [Bacteroidia bacterium]